MILPPVNRDDILQAFGKAFTRPENVRQVSARPRASSLASCARQQAYAMAGTQLDDIGVQGSALNYDADLTSEQGRAFEGLMERTFESMGIQVVNSQVSLPDGYPVSGHPDGELDLSRYNSSGANISHTSSLRWGVEFKHLGRYSYRKTIVNGLRIAHPQYILQAGLYGDALGWDAVLYVVSSQDASSIRGEATAALRNYNRGPTKANRWVVDNDWHPKLHIETLEMKEVSGLIPIAHARARWLSDWMANSGNPAEVRREYEPNNAQFPCSYCPYLSSCLADGDTGKRAPELPFRMDD